MLDKGRLLDDGPPESVLIPASVAAVFGGRLKLLRDAGRLYILPTLQPHPVGSASA